MLLDYLNKNLSPEVRAKSLLNELSIEEKVAQLCGEWLGKAEADPKTYEYGLGQVSTLEFRREEKLEDCVEKQRKLQKKIMDSSRLHIPAIFHMEGLCGPFIQDGISYPSGLNRGASFDLELEEKIGAMVSRQEKAVGITQILAPVLDIAEDPRMGRQGETYGEDGVLSGKMGAAFTRGIQEDATGGRKADACAKHFAGFHKSMGGRGGSYCKV